MEYMLTPHATSAPFMPTVVALVAATTKTVLQVATPSTTDIRLCGWSLSFDGASGTAVPVVCQLIQTDVAATVTTMTPELLAHGLLQSSLCVGGTSASGYNASAEGTITAVRVFDQQHVHPQTGYGVFWAKGDRPQVPVSRFVRIRCLAPAGVNVIPEIYWDEPATD